MSRSELAQSIGESTLGKVTHRQGDFNRKLGNKRVPESTINPIFTTVYTIAKRGKLIRLVGRSALWAAGFPELMPQLDRSDRPQPSTLHLPGRADL
jgi:hypothetical protein